MRYGRTNVVVCEDAADLGRRAAADVAACMRSLLKRKRKIRMVFAAGESQNTFLAALANIPARGVDGLDWGRVVCFNMDDFWDPKMDRRFSCGHQTQSMLYDKVRPKAFHLVDCRAPDPRKEVERFEGLLRAAGEIDILCQGIGTSGHLALCEPGVKHFNDTALVKLVDLHPQSIRQLEADPNFQALGYIPRQGITMTIPALLRARHIFTMVPLGLKRAIVTRVLATPEPDENLPASILSRHKGTLYLDRDSCPPAAVHAR